MHVSVTFFHWLSKEKNFWNQFYKFQAPNALILEVNKNILSMQFHYTKLFNSAKNITKKAKIMIETLEEPKKTAYISDSRWNFSPC